MPPALSDDEMSDDNAPDSIPAKGKIPTKAEELAQAEEDEDDDESGGEEEYIVEKIKKHRFNGGTVEYQVKWLGYSKAADMTWEPVENLENATDILKAYHKEIGGTPEPEAKKGKAGKAGKRSASAAFDSPAPAASGKKAKGGRQSDVANGTPAKKVLPSGTWENDVQRVTSILEEAEDPTQKNNSNVLIGLLEWTDGTKTQHKMDALRRKCPQKLLDYYEQHLVFRNDTGE